MAGNTTPEELEARRDWIVLKCFCGFQPLHLDEFIQHVGEAHGVDIKKGTEGPNGN